MGKILRFIKEKCGWKTFVSIIALLLLAGTLTLVGIIYTDFGGNWAMLGEILTNQNAISVYIIIGVIILGLIAITLIANSYEEIK